jgi:predicted dehydrogenase
VAAIRAGKHVIVEKPLEITTARCDIEVEDTAAATIQFANGALGVIEGTTGAYPGFLKKIEICGSKGCVTMEEESITTWQFADERPEDEKIRQEYGKATATGGGVSAPKAIVRHGYRMLLSLSRKPYGKTGP